MTDSTISILFRVRAPGKSQVIVVGDANYLGQWNPEAGILMSVVGPDLFEAEIKIPNNCNKIIQYKYCSTEQNDSTINWESGENRLLTLTSNIFVVEDLYAVSYALINIFN